MRPIIKATLPAPCINPGPGCSGIVQPDDRFDVSHLTSHHLDPWQPLTAEMVGPAHVSCNRRAGGKEGRAKQIEVKRIDRRLPSVTSGW